MKRLFLTALLILSILPASGQRRVPRRVLEARNVSLERSLDSLRRVVDSIAEQKHLQDSLAELRLGLPEDAGLSVAPAYLGPDFAPEDMDSLLAKWFESNNFSNFEVIREYDLDSVRFSSDVPDEVLMRRLEDMNIIFPVPFNSTVRNCMVLYSEKYARHMGRILGLSNYYFPIFEEALSRYGLPLELKYLTIVESMLNPTATSRAGAKGVWQFTYRTARGYNLGINSYIDERLDVELASDAAARYLRDAYRIFGDWCLAISSYNCGAGNVKKAIMRAGGKTDYWSVYPFLPKETRRYVPGFVGAMYAMTYYKEYGIVPADVGMPARVDTFQISRKLHFKQISEVVGIPLEDIEYFNPKYVHDIVPGSDQKSCSINIPFNWSTAFLTANVDSLYNHKASEYLSEAVIKGIEDGAEGDGAGTVYKVKSGDYLGKIAAKYHCTVAQLKKWNHLRSDRLSIGQVLYIYR